jgi:hypothetical protein
MKTIFAVKDKELGWVGFQTAEEAGEGATQINCYENLSEFNDVKLEKVRQGALAKLTDAEKVALGLTEVKVASPTSTPSHPGVLLEANPHMKPTPLREAMAPLVNLVFHSMGPSSHVPSLSGKFLVYEKRDVNLIP